ncbi:MAG TPA: hypothetical protein VNA24_06965 [Hyalangium sp.]|nr:hypothetical protein [Hyalangium sp.]
MLEREHGAIPRARGLEHIEGPLGLVPGECVLEHGGAQERDVDTGTQPLRQRLYQRQGGRGLLERALKPLAQRIVAELERVALRQGAQRQGLEGRPRGLPELVMQRLPKVLHRVGPVVPHEQRAGLLEQLEQRTRHGLHRSVRRGLGGRMLRPELAALEVEHHRVVAAQVQHRGERLGALVKVRQHRAPSIVEAARDIPLVRHRPSQRTVEAHRASPRHVGPHWPQVRHHRARAGLGQQRRRAGQSARPCALARLEGHHAQLFTEEALQLLGQQLHLEP